MSIPNFLLTKAPGAKFTMSANPILPPFVVGSSPIVTLTGTSISNVLPSSIKAGDLLVTFVFARSTLTAPLGWDLVDSNSHTNPTPTEQSLYVYTKRAEVTDASESITYTQSTSNRMSAQTVVVRGSAQVEILRNSKRTASNSLGGETQPSQLPLALLTDVIGKKLVLTGVDVITVGSISSMWISGGSDLLQLTTPASTSDPANPLRLCVLSQVLDSDVEIDFDTNALMLGLATTTDNVGSITLELGYA